MLIASVADAADDDIADSAKRRSGAKRIVAIDWTSAESLLTIGVAPIGIGDLSGYGQWVVAPSVPASVEDVGLRAEPNIEVLMALRPECILIGPELAGISDILSRIASTRIVTIYRPGTNALRNAESVIQTLGKDWDRRDAATAVIERGNASFDQQQKLCSGLGRRYLVFQFIDDLHVRAFGTSSMFDAVLQRIGLKNAWIGKGGAFGFDVIELAVLRYFDDAILVVVAPTPYYVARRLMQNAFWLSVLGKHDGRVMYLDAVWPFGGFASAQRFATLLTHAVVPTGSH